MCSPPTWPHVPPQDVSWVPPPTQFPAELEERCLRAVHHSLSPRLDDLVSTIYEQHKPGGKENVSQSPTSGKQPPQLSKKVLKRWIQEVIASTHFFSDLVGDPHGSAWLPGGGEHAAALVARQATLRLQVRTPLGGPPRGAAQGRRDAAQG